MNELFIPFSIETPALSGFQAVNTALAVLSSIGLLSLARPKLRLLARPAFIVALLAHLIFQWPLAVFSPVIGRGMTSPWFFAVSVHVAVLAGALCAWLTRRMVAPATRASTLWSRQQPFRRGSVIGLLGLYFALTVVYLSAVNWKCTGLYAMLVDPELSLLARELSGKLTNAKIASYCYGVLVNVVCPLLAYVSALHAYAQWKSSHRVVSLLWVTVGASAFAVALLTGAKGNLLPTIIVLSVGMLASPGLFRHRAAAFAATLGFGLLLLASLEVARERVDQRFGGYDVGACAVRLGACSEATTLVDSLQAREASLGMTLERVEQTRSELTLACKSGAAGDSPTGEAVTSGRDPSAFTRHTPTAKATEQAVNGASLGRRTLIVLQRLRDYFFGILNRSFVVPIQVATWHFEYTVQFGSPGWRALPGAGLLFGERVIMPSRVYEAYYPIYASGDRTSTGTSPTTFLMAYPAYLGAIGIALAAMALVAFDLAASLIVRRLGRLMWAGVGVVAGFCVTFMASDFGTTLMSHGAAAGLVILLLLSVLESRSKPEQSNAELIR